MISIRCTPSIFAPLALMAVAAQPARGLGQARSELAASGLASPLFVAAPEGDARLFVVERAGRIRVVQVGVTLPAAFLDIQSQVNTIGEGGLLGLAFAPDYAQSGLFYVYYTNLADDSVVSRFSVSADPNVANPAQTLILSIDQPNGSTNHKGGTIAFGPDGFLWFATGDGGGAFDPNELAQDPQSLLGKMLRLDVGPVFAPLSISVAGQVYRIPVDNPFVGDPGPRDEIWALGLRNPYRWSFDRETGDVWIGDVGQGAREEVDFEPVSDPGGRNYGWDVMEGTLCNPTDPALAPPCNDPSLTLPVHQYDHSGGRCSITGGNVFRGPVSPLTGLYFFGDYCSRQIWSLDPDTLSLVDRTGQLAPAAGTGNIVGFGEDGFGTPHVVLANGNVYRILPADPPCADGVENDGDGLVDFPADPGCMNASGALEDPACDDGLDNDGEGGIDWDGAGVGPADPQCQGNGWRTREKPKSCGVGFELALLLPALLGLQRALRRA